VVSKTSIAPDGASFAIPSTEAIDMQFAEIERRAEGRKVVVVQGLGFVGSAVAAVIAAARNSAGEPAYFVIGVDLATPASYWKISRLNEGHAPIASPDAEFDRLVAEGVHEFGNLCATSSERAYELAHVIVVDVQLDVVDRAVESAADIQLRLTGLDAAIRVIGRRMRSDDLVVVETTVPFGACERLILPVLREERQHRGLTEPLMLAHAYERVMPGPRYISSIRKFWRTFAGIDERSAQRAREFLDSFIDTSTFPLRELGDPTASEMAKILENSYRAANIAFIHEWTLLAERTGVNLWEIVDSIRVREGTHDNMRYPGFGVGGYCLTKDSLLAQWSATHLFKVDHLLSVTLQALGINHRMPLHARDLLRELVGKSLSGLRVLVCGVSYLPDVADTRNSPTEIFVDALVEEGATVEVHDPSLRFWPERSQIPFVSDLNPALHNADAVVLAVPHGAYRRLASTDFARSTLIVDANNVLDDAKAEALHLAGGRLLGVGKGHWRKRGYDQISSCPKS
jgi:nucleotide sugar dehydrogenase